MLNGYEPIINGLAKNLDVKLNTLVRKIVQQKNHIEIITNQQTYQSDYVLITVPLGALKHQLIQFEPALPAAKQAAINHLEMGVYDKVIFKFPQVFWPAEYHTIHLSRYRDQYLSLFFNDSAFCQQPILSGIINYAKAKEIDKLSDEKVIADTMETFKYYFGNHIPEPTAYRITHWWKDPLTYGSYSFIPYGASGDDYDMLAEPVNNRLFFAGEATYRKHLATVHGAYLSGIREADRIIDIQK
jgi:monoamine oxidase